MEAWHVGSAAIVMPLTTYEDALQWRRDNTESIQDLVHGDTGSIGSIVVGNHWLNHAWLWVG